MYWRAAHLRVAPQEVRHFCRIGAAPGAAKQGDVASAALLHPCGEQQAQPAGAASDDVLGRPVEHLRLHEPSAL